MSARRPEPKLSGGVWRVDLRWAGFGRFELRTPGDPARAAEAIHEAYERLTALQAQARGPLPPPAPRAIREAPTIAIACDLWKPGRKPKRRGTKGGLRYVDEYIRAIVRELGHLDVAAFEPPHGTELWADYTAQCKQRGLSVKSRSNRNNMLLQLLQFCQGRGWLVAIPGEPEARLPGDPPRNAPDWQWLTETDFREVRARIHENWQDGNAGSAFRAMAKRRKVHPEALRAQLRLYLSVAFYAGLHTSDLDGLLSDHLSWQMGTYLRVNSKSAHCIPVRAFDMPEQLQLDCAEEIARLQRHWYAGEPVCGGAWDNNTREITRIVKRMGGEVEGLPVPLNFRVLRRSTAYHYCLLGWDEREVSEVLGHVDQRMIREVYLRVPVSLRSSAKLDWTNANMKRVTGGHTARAQLLPIARQLDAARKGPHREPAPARKLGIVKGGGDGK